MGPRPAARPGSGTSTPSGTPSSGPASGLAASITASGIIGRVDKSGRIVEFTSPEDKCPQCKTDRFLNPKLKLLVSPCYHKLCTSCIDRIYALGPAPCPECGVVCRKSQFGSQTFQDLSVEREVDVRKRVQRIYNKQQSDFASLSEYNNYLEEVEQITFNLLHKVDTEATHARIAAYEAANKASASRMANQSESESAAMAQSEARLLALRKARAERRKRQDLEDVQWKQEEQREIVAALEDGLEEEDIGRIHDKWAEKRAKRDEEREVEELREIRQEEEEQRRMGQAGQRNKSRATGSGNGSSDKGAGAATAPASPFATSSDTWRPESMRYFTGPLAQLSTGLELFESADTLQPPEALRVDRPGQIPHDQSGDRKAPYDPWTAKVLTKMSATDVEAFKAGGYDWCEWWKWELSVAGGSMGVHPQSGTAPKATAE